MAFPYLSFKRCRFRWHSTLIVLAFLCPLVPLKATSHDRPLCGPDLETESISARYRKGEHRALPLFGQISIPIAETSVHDYFEQRRDLLDLDDLKGIMGHPLLSKEAKRILRAWVSTVHGDENTYLHCFSVAYLSTWMAMGLGLDVNMVWTYAMGGLIHDIGKRYVSPSIINKPGNLTSDERQIMQRHPEIWEQVAQDLSELVPAEVLSDLLSAVRDHHERMNGRGYPYGKTRDEIPQIGQVVAVADIFSALTAKRSYKKAYSIEVATGILWAMANDGELNPVYVHLLERVIHELNPAYEPRPQLSPVQQRPGAPI